MKASQIKESWSYIITLAFMAQKSMIFVFVYWQTATREYKQMQTILLPYEILYDINFMFSKLTFFNLL